MSRGFSVVLFAILSHRLLCQVPSARLNRVGMFGLSSLGQPAGIAFD